ncbi:MAG: hypothetical protein K0U93_30715 [Gammaproteobacteria bacterium]|nr:hypothetical protein [Gammaproteobacteria bacterium]
MQARPENLIPSDAEILRRFAEHLDFTVRLHQTITEAPGEYYLGEDADDLVRIFNAADLQKLIERLMDPKTNERAGYKKEALLGAPGEAKTTMLGRLRDKVMSFMFGGGRKSQLLSSLSEYTEYLATVSDSLEVVARPYAKPVTEFYGFMKMLLARAADRASAHGD